MLGFIGFFIAAVIVSFFAVSFYTSFKELNLQQRQSFSGAFLLLGLAFFVWGFAPLLDSNEAAATLVFAGDVLLVIGSALLVKAQFKIPPLWVTIALAIFATVVITLRAYAYPPDPSIQDGLLHFNLEGGPRVVVIAMLAFIWMPLGIRITQLAVRSRGLSQFGGVIALIYTVSLVSAALFLGARQNGVIIGSFAVLAFTFLMLAFIPLLINKYSKINSKPEVEKKEEEHSHGK